MLDEMLTTLANKHRRRLLVSLLGSNSKNSVKPPEEIYLGKKELKDLQTEMYHVHLPKLEEAGYIQWEQEDQVVTQGPKFTEIKPLLELMKNHADELPDNWL